MADLSNDKFGIIAFRDANGTIQFQRADAKNTSDTVIGLTVGTAATGWCRKQEFRNMYATAMVLGTGTGRMRGQGVAARSATG